MSKRFQARVFANVLYSAIITGLIEVFLITNITMIMNYMVETGYYDSDFFDPSKSAILWIIMYVLSGIGIFTLCFLMLQDRSMKYISEISAAMQNISEGDLNTTIEVRGDDEFSGMAANLNKLAEDIKILIDKEREAERSKNELITNVAHDLRTPLTSTIGYLELLSNDTSMDEVVRKKYISIAYAKSKRLEKLIEDLFGFTKLNYGKISMRVASVDIVKLLDQLLEEFYPKFIESHLAYELLSNVTSKMITADGNLMARLFENLINNAIKYGADGKRVIVQIDAKEDLVSISVINYGYVIPKKELHLIFDKFYRLEQSRATTTGGTGLGLAIAKNIVQMHGGTIDVSSDYNGTIFQVKLKTDFDVDKENFGGLG